MQHHQHQNSSLAGFLVPHYKDVYKCTRFQNSTDRKISEFTNYTVKISLSIFFYRHSIQKVKFVKMSTEVLNNMTIWWPSFSSSVNIVLEWIIDIEVHSPFHPTFFPSSPRTLFNSTLVLSSICSNSAKFLQLLFTSPSATASLLERYPRQPCFALFPGKSQNS